MREASLCSKNKRPLPGRGRHRNFGVPFRLPSDAALDRDKLFRLSWESESRCWRLPATSGCGLPRPASTASPPRFSDDGFADAARLTAHSLPFGYFSPSSSCRLYLELDNCIGSAPLTPGDVAARWLRSLRIQAAENSVKVASHRFGVFCQF